MILSLLRRRESSAPFRLRAERSSTPTVGRVARMLFACACKLVPTFAQTFSWQGVASGLNAAGNLYVLEIDANGLLAPEVTGRLAQINAEAQAVVTIASQGLVMPGLDQ